MAAHLAAAPRAPRLIPCEECYGSGRYLSGHPGSPSAPRDLGPCEYCHGEGAIEIEAEPIEQEDSDHAQAQS